MDDLLNRFMNKQDGLRRPILTMYAPADIQSIAMDHDYMALTMEDDFLAHEGLSKICKAVVDTIEQATRAQRNSVIWKRERSKRITSSNFGSICKATERRDMDLLVRSMISPDEVNSPAIAHGKKYEDIARKKFEEQSGLTVGVCGLFVSMDHPVLAATPDGIVNNEILVEIKCPYSAFHKEASPENVPFLIRNDNGEVALAKNHNYSYQVQGQLFCTGRKLCKFIVYTSKGLYIQDVCYDNQFIKAMLAKLNAFYHDYFKTAVIKHLFYKNTISCINA